MSDSPRESAGGQALTVAFYNVENLYDPRNDPHTEDEAFTPEGEYRWGHAEYAEKKANLAQVIADLGPHLLGLAEVENARVVKELLDEPALRGRGYRFVHTESDDERGIDLALAYDPAQFTYLSHRAYRLEVPRDPDIRSRPILMVEGQAGGTKLYLFVNHWPSRREGEQETEHRRVAAARQIRSLMRDIARREDFPAVLVLGDFNDDPSSRSIASELDARPDPASLPEKGLYNPMRALHDPEERGSLTYQGKWNLFDQILLSEDLVTGEAGLRYIEGSAEIFRPEYLQVGGEGRSKDMPRRSIHRGEFQERGFSDHFPVLIRLRKQ
jgi:predicted extracellular nuclease